MGSYHYRVWELVVSGVWGVVFGGSKSLEKKNEEEKI